MSLPGETSEGEGPVYSVGNKGASTWTPVQHESCRCKLWHAMCANERMMQRKLKPLISEGVTRMKKRANQ